MTEMEPGEAEIDRLLRRSMAAPVPVLPAAFEKRLTHKVRRGSLALDQYRRILLTSYCLVSALVSVVVMRGQGLRWEAIAGMILAPLALVAATRPAWRAIYTTRRHSSR